MMHTLIRSVLCIVLFMLSACTSYQHAVELHKEKTTCIASCQLAMQHCKKMCLDSCPNCSLLANQRATAEYKHYKHQRAVQGRGVALELKSFRDPLQCTKTTCDCSLDYRVCTQACTGKIHKRLQALSAC